MNTNDLLLRWSNLSLDQIEKEIRDGKDLETVTELLGPEVIREARAVSFAAPGEDREPVVLLPGIMGSMLSSIRGVTSLVWINPLMFVQGNARYLLLSDDGGADGCSEVEIVPVGLEKMTYLKLGLNLNKRAELYEFPYDWRRPVEYNADQLKQRVERWSTAAGRKVTLVAHSMGGLVSRAYLARHPQSAEKHVKQVITLGTPYFGSTNAVETLFTGNSLMDTVDSLNKQNAMREVVRSFPGLYNLLPPPPETFPAGYPYAASWDIYHAASWRIPGVQQRHLDNTRGLHKLLATADPQVPVTQIAGCNLETLNRIDLAFDGLEKAILNPDKGKQGEQSGDGTVPLWSARLPGANMYYIEEKHSDLPNNKMVIEATIRLLQGGKAGLPDKLPAPRRRIGGLSFGAPGEEEAAAEVVSPEAAAADLEAKIRSGTASQDDLKKLYFAL